MASAPPRLSGLGLKSGKEVLRRGSGEGGPSVSWEVMRKRIVFGLMILAATASCTTTSDTPATAPSTSSTTSPPIGTLETTTTVATTTTLDRIAEIEAIFYDLEVRRLQAIKDQDEEAFRAIFANDAYEEASVAGFVGPEVLNPSEITLVVEEVLVDAVGCIAASVTVDGSGAVVGAGSETHEWVIEQLSGIWGLSYIGSGWRCEGPHPLES